MTRGEDNVVSTGRIQDQKMPTHSSSSQGFLKIRICKRMTRSQAAPGWGLVHISLLRFSLVCRLDQLDSGEVVCKGLFLEGMASPLKPHCYSQGLQQRLLDLCLGYTAESKNGFGRNRASDRGLGSNYEEESRTYKKRRLGRARTCSQIKSSLWSKVVWRISGV